MLIHESPKSQKKVWAKTIKIIAKDFAIETESSFIYSTTKIIRFT